MPGSYFDEYLRTKAFEHHQDKGSRRLMTDRNAYISYLEVQLERVSAACLTSNKFEDRITNIARNLESMEDRVVHVGKLSKLTQSFAEVETTNNHTLVTSQIKQVETVQRSAEKQWTEIQHIRERLDHSEDGIRQVEVRMTASMEKMQETFMEKMSRMEIRMESTCRHLAENDKRISGLSSNVQEGRGSLSISESRMREHVAKELEAALEEGTKRNEVLITRQKELDDKMVKNQHKFVQLQSSESARVACAMEEHVERFEGAVASLTTQVSLSQHQYKEQNRLHAVAQGITNSNLIALQKDWSDAAGSSSAPQTATLLLALTELKDEASRRETQIISLEAEFRKRLEASEAKTHELAKHSLVKTENQHTKLIELLKEIEKRVQSDMSGMKTSHQEMISAKENLTEKYRHLLKAVHSYDEESVRDQTPRKDNALLDFKKQISSLHFSTEESLEQKFQSYCKETTKVLEKELHDKIKTTTKEFQKQMDKLEMKKRKTKTFKKAHSSPLDSESSADILLLHDSDLEAEEEEPLHRKIKKGVPIVKLKRAVEKQSARPNKSALDVKPKKITSLRQATAALKTTSTAISKKQPMAVKNTVPPPRRVSTTARKATLAKTRQLVRAVNALKQ